MIEAGAFIRRAHAYGFSLYTGVPCSYLKPFINYAIDAPDMRYVGAVNEGDAVAVAAGAELAGQRGVVMFQNSGFGNAVNALTSLTHTFRIPVLIIVTLRGEPGGPADEPQHELMGQITGDLLDLTGISWDWFPSKESEIEPVLKRVIATMDSERRPFALIMRKGSVAKHALQSVPQAGSPQAQPMSIPLPTAQRTEMLAAVQTAVGMETIVIATTGYTGRELYALEDRPGQLYMVGSMGCAASLGLGVALARPDRRVVVLDGDGALLMRLGALAMLGNERPPNLVHVLFDNGMHESTGGQTTLSAGVDFCALASACGYPSVVTASEPDALGAQLATPVGQLRFIYAPIRPGVPEGLPRPIITPVEVAERLRAHIVAGG
ncbi:MAG: phosphonopyruvate decarboxylase [Gammaproteobacteria bacterium]|jgi:phosphonopyruvate decarboxylase|nr:phosphonopyruvate decarboxylase [Chromatiales bacterium]MCP4924813.1 phosphonopyruvate decarboxylase [Gammaproteobacteria bacterium]MDP7154063.1 phosphonopyruvate decarboxylase [Gammaproteobacteria bacterium]MDP7296137.1 phosphonopyruvate decarboxylase [Gammaproteobacteria bacterium]MDP7418254.1 phosphonopyruvate decarboxylase [Gammaproteobacteria bacterium]